MGETVCCVRYGVCCVLCAVYMNEAGGRSRGEGSNHGQLRFSRRKHRLCGCMSVTCTRACSCTLRRWESNPQRSYTSTDLSVRTCARGRADRQREVEEGATGFEPAQACTSAHLPAPAGAPKKWLLGWVANPTDVRVRTHRSKSSSACKMQREQDELSPSSGRAKLKRSRGRRRGPRRPTRVPPAQQGLGVSR